MNDFSSSVEIPQSRGIHTASSSKTIQTIDRTRVHVEETSVHTHIEKCCVIAAPWRVYSN
jgi:hypothetical protein